MLIMRTRDRQQSLAGRSRAGSVSWSGGFDQRDLLALALLGDASAPAKVCDRHGAALFSLACAVLGDHEDAEAVVVDVVVAACSKPGTARPDRSLRHELARLTYLRSAELGAGDEVRPVWLTDPAEPGWGSVAELMTEVRVAAGQQRTALALIRFGDHTYREVAELLGLPVMTVAALLCSALHDLQPAGGSHCARGRRRPRLVPRGWTARGDDWGRDDDIG